MDSLPSRFLSFEGCFNFRDLGGYAGLDGRPVRWRRLFRSMTPQYMTRADLSSARVLNIALVIDFRGPRFTSSGSLADPPARRLALGPSFSQPFPPEYERFLALPPPEGLPRILDLYAPYFTQALKAIEAERKAAVFHCRLGKDRTGVFTALLLKLLGVADEDVYADYLLTGQHEADVRRLLADRGEKLDREPRVAHDPVGHRAIEGVLERLVSQFGGAYGYFASHGVSAATLEAFVEGMLEPGLPQLGSINGGPALPSSIPA
jgi:protein-tyrosine phosphatase